MEDIASLITEVRAGHPEAYEPIVRRFQDMAVGYGYARLGDLQLAEDAAQEAFIAAYFDLASLHDPQAFPGWFRRIVIKQIDRVRRKRRSTISLKYLVVMPAEQHNPIECAERQELQDAICRAIEILPPAQREVVTLFYIGEHSHNDISAFLSIPVSTVKMRLYHGRKLLQQQLLSLIEGALPNQRPSRNNSFVERIMSYQVQSKDVPAQQVISITRDSFIHDLQAHLDGGIKTLTVYAQQARVQVAGLPMAIYHGTVGEDQHAQVEICLPVTGDIPPTIEIAVKDLPPAQVAYTVTTLRQSIFPGVLKAYEALEDWMQAHHYQATDSPREIYLKYDTSIFSPTAGLDDPCVEIARPYR